ncbi:YegJ family protein [Escherichia coli]|nr:YegJ family protein [Escherichia coli]
MTGGYDKQAMSDAIKHARKETDKFIEVMNKKDADTFAVKAPITDHGRTEHFWLTDVTYSNGMFIGVISNDPWYCYKRRIWPGSGKSRKKIFQTGCIRAGDKIYGGYTINPLLVTYPKEEADELRAKLVR